MQPSAIYMDHSATTAVDKRVIEAMLPYFTQWYGNPSSLYFLGQKARQATEIARGAVATILNCVPREVIFTSCGTESDNLAIRGVALARQNEGRHLITSPIEHKAVLDTMKQLQEEWGFEITILPVDAQGRISPEEVARALRPDTILVSLMYANNEVGTIQPIAEIGALLRQHPATFQVDAVQAGGYLPLDVEALGVDMMALSGHKFHAPKGVGILYVRRGTPYLNTMTGGAQEGSQRAGTQNVPYIVAIAKALDLAQSERTAKNAQLVALRDRLISGILAAVPTARLTGHPSERLPGHASFTMGEGLEADAMLLGLDIEGIAASSGSACTSGRNAASHVLTAMGVPYQESLSALRLTLGDENTIEEIEYAVKKVPEVVERLQAFAAV
ncbi:MAG: cysteine desulfurase [Ardenticatenales bacterium]|nr:cysteine desulfurase [Ardenticatenales bacterium]